MTKKNKKKMAYGGIPLDMESPQEAMARYNKNTALASYEAAEAAAPYEMIGDMLFKTGTTLLGQGLNQLGGFGNILSNGSKVSGFGKVLDAGLGITTKFTPRIGSEANMFNINTKPGTLEDINMNDILGYTKGLFAASGGIFPEAQVEAEGGEVIEVPGGEPIELQGPSHEAGGINLNVPQNTEFYSKRVKGPDGKTMAKRKKDREAKLARLESKLNKNPNDNLLRKTIEKVKANNDILDKQDLALMQQVRVNTPEGEIPEFGLGGVLDFVSNILGGGGDGIPSLATPPINPTGGSNGGGGLWDTLGSVLGNLKNVNPLKGLTFGDAIGMYANYQGPNELMQNTINQYANTPKEVNWHKNYGQKALKTIRGEYNILEGIKDRTLQQAQLARNATLNRNANSTRGLNTMRALNLATDAQHNQLASNIMNNYQGQVLGIMDKEANLQSQIDQIVMSGEERRADRELRNMDNFYTNMAQNIATKYQGLKSTGDALNNLKERNIIGDLIQSRNYRYNTNTGKWEYNPDVNATVNSKTVLGDIRDDSSNKIEIFDANGKITEDFKSKIQDSDWNSYVLKDGTPAFKSSEDYINYIEKSTNPYFVEDNKVYNIWDLKAKEDGTRFTSKKDYEDYVGYKGEGSLKDFKSVSNYKNNKLFSGLKPTQIQTINNYLTKNGIDLDLSNKNNIKAIQKMLGVKIDGIFGKKTFEALSKVLGGK